jgi:uncharacterized membrane protein YfcA
LGRGEMIFVHMAAILFGIWLLCSIALFDSVGDFKDAIVQIVPWGLCAAIAAPGYGVYTWMREGEWTSLSLRWALDLVLGETNRIFGPTGWVGIDNLATRYLETNVGWTIAALAFAVFFSTAYWSEKASQRRLLKEHMARVERQRSED